MLKKYIHKFGISLTTALLAVNAGLPAIVQGKGADDTIKDQTEQTMAGTEKVVVLSETDTNNEVIVDKSVLESKLYSANRYYGSRYDYSVESVEVLNTTIDGAYLVYHNEETTQEEVDQAIMDIQAAIDGLVEEIYDEKEIIIVEVKSIINEGLTSKVDISGVLYWSGYSQELIDYALTSNEIDWKDLAVKTGQSILEYQELSKRNLIHALQNDLFTFGEAQYAADLIFENIDDEIMEGSIEEAIMAVEIAENRSQLNDLIFAEKLVADLENSSDKEALLNRLDKVQDQRKEDAVRLAKLFSEDFDYINSRQGVINRLVSIGYSEEEAVYGVDALNKDWYKQAAIFAELLKKDLEGAVKTREELIKDLKEYALFTHEEAVYGAKFVLGLNPEKPAGPEKPAKIGWVKDGYTWYYYDDAGKSQTGWNKIKGTWYYMSSNGAMQTGWTKVGNTWYYMNSSGAMQTGWTKVGNTWYYMNSSGAMQTGWTKVGSTWYYMSGSGAMQTGWTKVGNTWYYMTGSGAMQTGWQKINGSWYYLDSSGAMNNKTGWNKIGNNWYYQTSSGAMDIGWRKVAGNWYYMKDNAIMQTGWTKVGNTWYYMNSSGAMQTGWLKLGRTWYYLNSDGSMQVQDTTINGKWYRFDSSGRML